MDVCAACSDVSSGCAAPACGTTAVRSAIGRLAPAPRCRARRSSADVSPPPPPSTRPPSQLLLDRQQLGAQALAAGQPEHHELARAAPPTAVGEPQEVEGLRFALSS